MSGALREVVAIEMWCVCRSDRTRALAEWPSMLDIDKEHYYALADTAIAAVEPMIRAAEREEIAAVVQARGCLSDPCCDDIAALTAAIRARTPKEPKP